MSMNDNDYRPSYIWIHEGGKRKQDPKNERGIVEFDTLIITNQTRTMNGFFKSETVVYSAWGDGAHVAQNYCLCGRHAYESNCALHVGQIEKWFNEATEVTAILDHNVVYHDCRPEDGIKKGDIVKRIPMAAYQNGPIGQRLEVVEVRPGNFVVFPEGTDLMCALTIGADEVQLVESR